MPARKTTPKPSTQLTASRPDMPGYGIVAADDGEGLLPWSWALKRLTSTKNFYLCTVRPDGRPHVMPVWGVWVNDRFYFSTGKKSVKARNLAGNPQCVLCAGDAEEAVIVEGAVSKTRQKDSLKEFNAAYLKKYKMDVSGMNEPIFVLKPRVVFGQIEKTFTKSATRWRWV